MDCNSTCSDLTRKLLIGGASTLPRTALGELTLNKLSLFRTQAGATDKRWILFGCGEYAHRYPEWLAKDYTLLPVYQVPLARKSISGKTLNILGRRTAQLDCGHHSLCVNFYV